MGHREALWDSLRSCPRRAAGHVVEPSCALGQRDRECHWAATRPVQASVFPFVNRNTNVMGFFFFWRGLNELGESVWHIITPVRDFKIYFFPLQFPSLNIEMILIQNSQIKAYLYAFNSSKSQKSGEVSFIR